MKELNPKLRDEIDRTFRKAFKAQRVDREDEALKLARKAWDAFPEPKFDWDVSKSYTHALAKLYCNIKRYQDALSVMKSLFDSGTVLEYQSEPYFVTGTIYCEMGDLRRAKEWFTKANKISKGRCFRDAPEKYRKVLEVPSGTNREDLDTLIEEGNQYFDKARYTDAINRWKNVLDLLPLFEDSEATKSWLCTSIGDAYYQMKDYTHTKEYLYDALNTLDAQSNPFILYRLGQALYRLNEKEKAIEYLTRAYMIDGRDIFKADDKEGESMLALLRKIGVVG